MRNFKILRLFFGLVTSFSLQYLGARLTGRHYDFFADSKHNRKRAIRIRTVALQMGGVLIKVGQFLSSRVDLLPTEYIEELALLQDEVPGVPFEEVRAIVERELGAPLEILFASFDPEPLAAASLGQVHRAQLPTGEIVAVKVQRPNIGAIVAADLQSLRYIVHWLHRHTAIGLRADLPQIMTEFEETLMLELDYIREGHHADRFALEFREHEEILVPRIYWSHTTDRVLTMQFMTGVKVTDFAELERQDINRSEVAKIMMTAYLDQVLRDGFFHADPHPGNIYVRPGPVVVFLDFGMVGDIGPATRDNIQRVFTGVIRRDFDSVLAALEELGFVRPGADRTTLRLALVWIVDTFYRLSFGELKSVDLRRATHQLQDVVYSGSVQVPANYAFLGRALGTLSGLCTALDPSFQFMSVAEPYAREALGRRPGFLGTVDQVAGEARALATTAYALPHLTRDALLRIQAGELTFKKEIESLNRTVERIERVLRRVVYGLLVTGFLIAGAYVFPTHYQKISFGAFVVAFILLVYVLLPYRRRR